MAKKNEDVVFVIYEDHLADRGMNMVTKIVKVPVRSRTKSGVTVDSCRETRFRTRLPLGYYHEHYEDAVKSFAHRVACTKSELKRMEQDLAAMRKEMLK